MKDKVSCSIHPTRARHSGAVVLLSLASPLPEAGFRVALMDGALEPDFEEPDFEETDRP